MLFEFFKNRKSRKQLLKENEELKRKIEELYYEEKRIISTIVPIKTLSASCISWEDKGDYAVSKQCISYELAEQLIPYIKFEHYKIADGTHSEEMKHTGTIQILEK